MKSLLKRITACMLMFVVLSSMVLSGKVAVYADETTAAEGETTATESGTTAATTRSYRRIFVVGDSTVCNWDAVGTAIRELGTYDPQAGWVEMIKSYITDSQILQIQDGANEGYSIKTYYDGSTAKLNSTNQLTTVLATSGGGQPGDYLLIHFGGQSDATAPNDSMTEEEKKLAEVNYVDIATFKEYLKLYISDAREMNVTPILVTPIADWNVDESGNFVSSYAEYVQAVKDVAAEEGTLLIDMDKKSRDYYATLDEEELKKIFLFCEEGEYDTEYSAGAADTKNFQIYGAVQMARLVAEGLVETGEEWLVNNITGTELLTEKPEVPNVVVKQNKEKVFIIEWSGATGAQVYYVYQMVDGEWKLVKQTETTMFTVKGEIDEANCEYKVVALNNAGYSEDSNIVKRDIAESNGAEEETTKATTVDDNEKGGVNPIVIVVIVVVVVAVIGVVVFIVLKKRNDEDEYDEDEYDEDEYDEDEYDEDEYDEDEYDEDEYDEDEYDEDEYDEDEYDEDEYEDDEYEE